MPMNVARQKFGCIREELLYSKNLTSFRQRKKSIIYPIGATSLLQSVCRFGERETGGILRGWFKILVVKPPMTFIDGQSWCPVTLLIGNLQWHFIHTLGKTLLNMLPHRGCMEKFWGHAVENGGMSEGRLFPTRARRPTAFKNNKLLNFVNATNDATCHRYFKSDTSCPTDVVQHEKNTGILWMR
ncbi:hypothetical protein AVEN_97073-1 [Araneus ventricosus]|uniref:Uncharacterized protein n=1 Tax=Araneus ventricosus TaxID=182803 RepID=A0A4Y2EH13_ARAVE|nr:hypothetical protein AVEN_97073-1 [Araneus ventricosus]